MAIQLKDGDSSLEYFEDYKVTDLIKSSSSICQVDETSYKLVKNLGGQELDRSTGQGYVMIDPVNQQIYVDKAKAISSSFTAFLVANTLSGISGSYEFKFKITKKLNEAPEFVSDIEDILITVDQREQVESGLGSFTFESPTIKDPEGHALTIDVSGFESITGSSLEI